MLPKEVLNNDFKDNRNASTAIYLLLSFGQFSAFHKILSDEMWHFYAGQTLTIYEIEKNGNLITHKLGADLEKGETFQCVIKAGNWFGSRCEVPNGFSLTGCTVSPGFDFADFELANKIELCQEFPAITSLIHEMTY
jgi:predicted cupin superfamily sugar epimerase